MSEINTIRLKISGMSCPGCVNNVKRALSAVAGVTAADVDLKSGEAIVRTGPDRPNPDYLIKAVEKAGFDAVILNAIQS